MSRADWEAKKADQARTRFSNRALATGRRGSTKNRDQLRSEQIMYRARFGSSPKPMPVISDVNGTYPDHHWTRRD